jgi:glyoxylase-like metal-dependent hydrolase (beta-lactamase superfamily II)
MNGLIGAAALALALAAPPHVKEPAPAPLAAYLEIIEPVAPRVWVIRQAEPFHLQPIGNVTVIEQTDGLVLIDAGGSPGSGRRIVALVKSVSRKPVKAVAITHWHGDHPLGLPAILAEWPRARVIATARTRENLTGKSMDVYAQGAADAEKDAAFAKRIDGFIAYLKAESASSKRDLAVREGFARTLAEIERYGEDAKGMYVAAPTETFTERLLLPDRTAPVELFHPGRANTDGDAAAWLPRQKVLVSGDLVVMPVPFGFGSYPAEWQRALQALKARRPAILIPGHGAPQRDLACLDRLDALIGDVRSQVAPLAAQGFTLDETRKRIDLSAQRQRFAGDDPWLRLWFDEFWSKPFVESAWKEAKGLPIEQGEG